MPHQYHLNPKPPDAPRMRPPDRSLPYIAATAIAAAAVVVGWGAIMLLTTPAVPAASIATPTHPQTVTIQFPTVDPLQHLALAAQATFYAPTPTDTPTPTATPSATPDATDAAMLTPHPIVYCGDSSAVVGKPCRVPLPPTPTPTPLAVCPVDLSAATPFTDCIWQGRP